MDGCSDIYWTNYTKETAQSWNCPSTKEQICSIIIFGECTVSRPFASKMHVVLPHLLTLQAGVRASDLFQEADLRAACLVAAQHLSPAPSVNSFKLCIWNCTGVISRSVPEWSFFSFFFFFFPFSFRIEQLPSAPGVCSCLRFPCPFRSAHAAEREELGGQAGMSGRKRRRAGSVYTGFATRENYNMELHSQQTIWLLRPCSKHMIYPCSSKQQWIEPVCQCKEFQTEVNQMWQNIKKHTQIKQNVSVLWKN